MFTIERSAAALFGLVTYGVHLTAFVRDPQYEGGLAIWTPTRSKTKTTYPGQLDNTVAGGIAAGYGVFETVVKECAEEASLPEDLVREKAKSVGAITYFYIRNESAGGESGLFQPEVEYCYDLDLTDRRDVVPKPCDDEVESFELLGVEEVKAKLREGRFKSNCALVILVSIFMTGRRQCGGIGLMGWDRISSSDMVFLRRRMNRITCRLWRGYIGRLSFLQSEENLGSSLMAIFHTIRCW